jgi:hypothetical protein
MAARDTLSHSPAAFLEEDVPPFLKHATIVTCPDPTLLWVGFYRHAPETAAVRLSRYTSEAYRSKQGIDARLAQLIVAHTVRRPGSVRKSITQLYVLVNCSNPTSLSEGTPT